MLKSQSLAHFPGDHFLPIIHSLVLFALFSLHFIISFYFLSGISHQRWPMVSYRSLSDSKSPQISRTFLSILVDLHYAVVRMISSHPLISKSSCSCTNPLVTIPRAPITIGFTVIFMFHSFFNSRSRYLYFISLSFNVYSVVSRNS